MEEAEGGLTAYERLRQQIQERNAAKLRQLGVTAYAEDLTTAIAAKKRAAPYPLRRSLRNRGMAPENAPADGGGGGGAVSASAAAVIAEEVAPKGHLPARSLNREAEEDAALMRVLRARMVPRGFALETEETSGDEGGEEGEEERKREGDLGAQGGSFVEPPEGEKGGVRRSKRGGRGKAKEAEKADSDEVSDGAGGVRRLPLSGKRVKGRGITGVKEGEGEGGGGMHGVKGTAVKEEVGEEKGENDVIREQGRAREAVEAGRLQLAEGDVCKLTKERIHNVIMLPFRDRLVVVAGDKAGQVGVWDLGDMDANGCAGAGTTGSGSADGSSGARASEDATGMFTFWPHRNPVSGLAHCPLSLSNVYTASYDGTIRFAFDPRACHGGPVGSWEIHEKKVGTISFCPGQEEIIATASTDRTVCLWDVRKMLGGGEGGGGKRRKTEEGQGGSAGTALFHAAHSAASVTPLMKLPHARATNSAYFSPDGAFLVSTSYDDTIRLWKRDQWKQAILAPSKSTPPSPKPRISKKHNNQTGRWVLQSRLG
ncbi:unnamed protein product [Closterium sp. NIES-64]|nr:unnamed protein product [Closterium sp. NIES-64]